MVGGGEWTKRERVGTAQLQQLKFFSSVAKIAGGLGLGNLVELNSPLPNLQEAG